MTYSEKLKDPRWQKKRLEVLSRDEWKCQECGEKERTLHVHHKTYVYGKAPWDYNSNNLLTLCEDCHHDEDFHKQIFTDALHGLLIEGYSYKSLYGLISTLIRPLENVGIEERIEAATVAASNKWVVDYLLEAKRKSHDSLFGEFEKSLICQE